jgi:hypothetical protein
MCCPTCLFYNDFLFCVKRVDGWIYGHELGANSTLNVEFNFPRGKHKFSECEASI